MNKSFTQKIISKLQSKTLVPFFFMGSCCRDEILFSIHELMNEGLVLDQAVSHPLQADLLVIAGPVNFEQVELLIGIYQNMSHPKWVMALGNCALSGGGFHPGIISRDISEVISVDVKVEGCPPSKEALKKAFEELSLLVEEGKPI